MDYSKYLDYDLYQNYYADFDSMHTSEPNVLYSTMDYKGHKLVGSCDTWNAFAASSLFLPSDDLYFSAVTAHFASEDLITGHYSNTSLHCDNAKFMTGLVNALKGGYAWQGTCHFIEWRVYKCKNDIVMCMNCHFSCGA